MSETACLESIAIVEVRDSRGNLKKSAATKKPIARMMRRVQVFDKEGRLKSDTGDVPSHSYTKQSLQILESKMRGSSSVQGKQTSGTVEGIPDSTYNGLTDMMRCDAQQNDATYGVVVGTGTGAESNNDYKLGTIIANGQAAGQLVYGPVSLVAPDINGSYVDFVVSRSYNNGSGDDVTAYEFGVYVKVGPPTAKIYCIIRDVDVGGKTVLVGDTATVTYSLKIGIGFTKQWMNMLSYCMTTVAMAGVKDISGNTVGVWWNSYYAWHAEAPFQLNSAGDNEDDWGIVIGSGDAAESMDDYKLGAKIIQGVGAGQLDYQGHAYITCTEVAGNIDLIVSRTWYNGGVSSVDIKEVGWCCRFTHSANLGTPDYACVIRDKFAGAVTVDPGDTATVQYTLRTNFAI